MLVLMIYHAVTALMTAKFKTGVSVVVPPVVRNVRLKLPAATAVTIRSYKSVPDF